MDDLRSTPHQTEPVKRIAVDYCPDAFSHSPESDCITITFDHRGGARWRSITRFLHGTFAARIQCPKGNTSGLNFNLYLSSLEGHKSQDEIDFEFLGKDKTIVQTNYYAEGIGNREAIHDLGFDCSDGFHEYVIKWGPDLIEWLIDGETVRREKRKEGEGFPEKPMYLYASVWDASYIDEGRWTGPYLGCNAPYICHYKDVRVPAGTEVFDDSCDCSSVGVGYLMENQTQTLKEIEVDYTPDACTHLLESDSITITFDHRGGSRWRSTTRFLYGTFGAQIQCPKGNTSGLNFNLYLSSLEGDKCQDEIDFEFLGKDKTILQTNYFTSGTGNRAIKHDLAFDCSEGFHEYVIKWGPDVIEWLIDGKMVRRQERKEGEGFPEKPMFLYASVWDASYIAEGSWTGSYLGCDAPYICHYKDVRVPVRTAVDH